MSIQIPITLPDEIYEDMIDFAKLSNQSIVEIISSLIDCTFGGITKKLKVPRIEVAVNNEQAKPQLVLTVPDATVKYLEGLYENWSEATAPETLMVIMPPDKDMANLFTSTIIGDFGTFSMRRRAEILVSKMSDAELLALLDAKDTRKLSDVMQMRVDELLKQRDERMWQHRAAKNEAYRRGLRTFPGDFLF